MIFSLSNRTALIQSLERTRSRTFFILKEFEKSHTYTLALASIQKIQFLYFWHVALKTSANSASYDARQTLFAGPLECSERPLVLWCCPGRL